MRVLVQWASETPGDYEEIDLNAGNRRNAWRNLPKRSVPTGGERLNQHGYYFEVVVDGLRFYGFDHVAVEPLGAGAVRVYGWVDDKEDPTFEYEWGEVWDIHPHRKDPRVGNRLNTYQVKTVYAGDLEDMARFFPQEASGGPVSLLPWKKFPMPPSEIHRHGIWVSQGLFERHFAVRREVSWRDW